MKKIVLFSLMVIVSLSTMANLKSPDRKPRLLSGDITENPKHVTPEGESKFFTKQSISCLSLFDNTYFNVYMGAAVEMISTADGKVYLNNILSELSTTEWIEGSFSDGNIIIELPQVAYTQRDEVFYLEVYDIDDDGNLTKSDNQTYTLVPYGEGGYIAENSNQLIGVKLSGYELLGDGVNCMELQTDVVPETPSDLKFEEWNILRDNETISPIKIAFDNNEIYIAGLYNSLPDACVKGVINGDKIEIPSGQFLGLTPNGRWWTYFQGCTITRVEDEELGEYNEYEIIPEFNFEYNKEVGLLKSMGSFLISCCKNYPDNQPVTLMTFERECIIKKQDNDVCLSPSPAKIIYAAPYIDIDPDWGFEIGYGSLQFEFLPLDIEYNLMDYKNLSFEIYLNGSAYTFTPEWYEDLQSPITEIPYDFSCGYDIRFADNQSIIIFNEPNETKSYGVVIIQKKDGEVARSEMTTYEFESGVGTIVDTKDIISVDYYDLNGRKVSNPGSGIYIQKVNFSDGTSKVYKKLSTK